MISHIRFKILFVFICAFLWLPATAHAKKTLRVMTYNIHHGEGTDGRQDLDRIAAVIKEAEPDLVALQEVDQKVKRSGQVDQPTELARLTGMQVVFGGNIPLEGGEYGNAVLSRLPIVRHQNHLLPRTDGGEQRGVLEVELGVPGKERLIFLATHLDHRRLEAQRIDSAKAINELAGHYKDDLVVLGGDLNDVPESNTLAQFLKHWKIATFGSVPTYPSGKPDRQLDFVLVYPASRWRLHQVRLPGDAVASDHRALMVELWRIPH